MKLVSSHYIVGWDNIREDILVISEESRYLVRFLFSRHWRVCTEGSSCRGVTRDKICPSIADVISWSLGSSRLCQVARGPILYLSGRRISWALLWSGLDRLPLKLSVIPLQFYYRWGILLCHSYLQKQPWVGSLIGQVAWLGERSYVRLKPDKYLGEFCPQSMLWIVCFIYFLYSESDTQLGGEYLDISIERMGIDGQPTFIIEFPVSGEEGFSDAFTWWVFMLVDCGLGFLCIFCTLQASNLNKNEPIGNNCLERIVAFWFSCWIQQSSKHLPGDGILLICNVFFFLSRSDNFCTHVHPVGWVGRDGEVEKSEEWVYTLIISMHGLTLLVVIQHEFFNETRNDIFITWFVSAGVGDTLILSEFHIHSLPKLCSFKLRIRLKSRHLCVKNISQIRESNLGLGWKELQAFSSLCSCWRLE